MKYKDDFVTNSSSTSYIISIKDELNKESFMKSIGINGDNDFVKFFEDIFLCITNTAVPIHEAADCNENEYKKIEDFLFNEGYSEETVLKVKILLDEGNRKVYFGWFSSSGNTVAEQYLCQKSFLFCDDELYFNGNISGW